MNTRWHTLELTVDTVAREAIAYALMEAGALGTETTDASDGARVTAYFDHEPQSQKIKVEMEKIQRR